MSFELLELGAAALGPLLEEVVFIGGANIYVNVEVYGLNIIRHRGKRFGCHALGSEFEDIGGRKTLIP